MKRLAQTITELVANTIIDYQILGPGRFTIKTLKAGGWVVVVLLVMLIGIYMFRARRKKELKKEIG